MRNSEGGERILRYMSRLRSHVSYANVMATIAVFVALGGTSYAVTQLPRNSVGSKQIRTGSVGASEIHTNAVRSKDIKNRNVALRDISLGARKSLRGQPGPAGPQGPQGPAVAAFTAAVLPAGNFARSQGTASQGANHANEGIYRVDFTRDVTACYAVASISTTRGNAAGGEILTEIGAGADARSVYVRTSESNGTLKDLPFHLIVTC
jgi:hypothetical protein